MRIAVLILRLAAAPQCPIPTPMLIAFLYARAASASRPSAAIAWPSATNAAASSGSIRMALLKCPAASACLPSPASARPCPTCADMSYGSSARPPLYSTTASLPPGCSRTRNACPRNTRAGAYDGSISMALEYILPASSWRPASSARLPSSKYATGLSGSSRAAFRKAALASSIRPRCASACPAQTRARAASRPLPRKARHRARARLYAARALPTRPAISMQLPFTMSAMAWSIVRPSRTAKRTASAVLHALTSWGMLRESEWT